MRTQSLSLVALCVCLTGVSLHPASADSVSDTKKVLEANFAKMAAALGKKDLIGYTQFYADDAVIINERGERRTKQQVVSQGKQVMQQAKSIKASFAISKLALQKGGATTTTLENALVVLPNPQTKKDVKLNVQTTAVFTWVQSGSNWKIKQIKSTAQKMLVDGKPVSQTK